MVTKDMLPSEEEKEKLLATLLREVNDSAPPRPIKEINNGPYTIALVVIVAAMTGGVILALTLRPDIDPLIIFASIPVIGAPTVLGLLTLMNSREAKIQGKEAAEQSRSTHLMVNSRLRLWMDAAEKISFAAGIAEGRARADKRTDDLAKEIAPTSAPSAAAGAMPVKIVGTTETLPVEIIKGDEKEPPSP